jgi:hypothetical protein
MPSKTWETYTLTREEAEMLAGAHLLPDPFRSELLARYLKEHGPERLLVLFANFLGLANSVVANTREFVELYLVTECNHHPHTAEQINLPTIHGALQGVRAAIKPVRGMCKGCAYRLGTAANQSPITAFDAEHTSQSSGDPFHCHEGLDERGEPTRLCAGYAAARDANFKEAPRG